VDEELACAMYDELIDRAGAAGFQQYEVANFARHEGPEADIPSRACAHNVNYWRGGFYYAAGPSAAGYEPDGGHAVGTRTRNWANTQMYCEQVERGVRPLESREELPELARAAEIAAFGLRMNAGWPYAAFQRATGFDLAAEWREEMHKLRDDGLAEIGTDRFRLNRRGLRLADLAAEAFLRS
jgi:oxygen-independent coproporphyrinogen-3 oxidase